MGRICDREYGDDSCPYCAGKRPLAGFNTLEVTNPELISEWSNDNVRNINEFLQTSGYIAQWVCSVCHGEYYARILYRVLGKENCPYCDDRKVLPGYNSFAVRHKDLLKSWDYLNNYILLDPDMISDSCTERVWWICENNPSHKYQLSPKQKIMYQKRHMESCSICKGRRRKRHHFF